MAILFITGIGTGVGKTYATGWLASQVRQTGRSVMTMKLVQTGCERISEDVLQHRKMMAEPWNHWDAAGITCPYVFPYPASPHLAAALAKQEINPSVIEAAVRQLSELYSLVLIEGVGGVAVPLQDRYTVLDFIAANRIPCIVVTSPRLGSINHTLLTLEALYSRNLVVKALLYNRFFSEPEEIMSDTPKVLKRFYPRLLLVDLPALPAFSIPAADIRWLDE